MIELTLFENRSGSGDQFRILERSPPSMSATRSESRTVCEDATH